MQAIRSPVICVPAAQRARQTGMEQTGPVIRKTARALRTVREMPGTQDRNWHCGLRCQPDRSIELRLAVQAPHLMGWIEL